MKRLVIVIPHAHLARVHWIRQNSVGTILDVACGEGYLYGVSFKIDLPPLTIILPKIEAVATDLRNYRAYQKRGKTVPPLKYFVQADAHHLPFKDKRFDTVTLSEILEHPVNPIQLLTEAKRLARKRILVTVPDEISWIKRRVFRHFSIIDSVEHIRLFTIDKLANLFKEASLTSFQIDHILFGDYEFYTAIIDGVN